MDPSELNRWSSRLLTNAAGTLAFMRDGPHDIRPALLLLFHAQDGRQFVAINRHGTGYLVGWCERRGKRVRPDVLAYASGDALAVLWCRRAPLQVTARARQLGIRVQTYLDLRTVALEMFQTRLHEARVRFASGKIYTLESPYSKTGTSPPCRSTRAAPGNAQFPFTRAA